MLDLCHKQTRCEVCQVARRKDDIHTTISHLSAQTVLLSTYKVCLVGGVNHHCFNQINDSPLHQQVVILWAALLKYVLKVKSIAAEDGFGAEDGVQNVHLT